MPLFLTRRQFVVSAVAGTLGAGAYGLTRAVQKVREAARLSADT